jgi:FkbM family methyltransferase
MPSIRVLGHALKAWSRNRAWAKHEPETPYLADLLCGGPVCLHVGASDGRHSYVMTKVAPRAHVYAFEPSAFSYEVLRLCLRWHGIRDRVTAIHAAVGDCPGEMLLVTPRKLSGRMGRSFAFVSHDAPAGPARPDVQDRGAALQRTSVVTLDAFCAEQGIKRVDFIRMDIEGAELMGLRGASGILDRDVPHVLVEIHPPMLSSRFGGSAEEVLEIFRSRGYRMFAVNGDHLEARDTLVEGVPWKDYFFIHPARAAYLPEGVFKARMAG